MGEAAPFQQQGQIAKASEAQEGKEVIEGKEITRTFTMKAGSPTDTFTIERRIYYERWTRVWNFLRGRSQYRVERYTDCMVTGISVEPTKDGQIVSYDIHVPRQLQEIHVDLKT